MSMGPLGILVALLVAGCAILAALGFRGRISVVGVDLGTTFSVIGINDGGNVQIIADKEGFHLVPSTVAFLENGEVAVGRHARRYQEHDPGHTIYNAKRFIGRDFSDPSLQKELAEHDFQVVQNPGNLSEGWFKLDEKRGHLPSVSPESVGSFILKHMLGMVADHLGYNQVDKAVIAVPAKFNARQRQATVEAYKQAGLKVTRILDEPTAAALAYGLHRKEHVHHILVYDFGGGTLDVSVLFVNDGSVEVMASEGDDHLGGSDFDQCLAHYIMEKLGQDVVSSDTFVEAEACGIQEPVCAHHMMYPLSEQLKRELSDKPSAAFDCLVYKPGIRGVEHCSLSAWTKTTVTVSKEEFENVCSDIFERAIYPVDRVLEETGLAKESIDEVVMVGGTTRIPKIREQLKLHLGVDQLNTHIDPDITVAFGAASIID